jgi:hypothetical protein
MYPSIQKIETPTPLQIELARETRENISTILRTMLTRLDADEDMAVYHFTGTETIKVAQLIFRGTHLVMVVGEDAKSNFTISICHLDAINLTCKIVKLAKNEPRKQAIGFISQDDPTADIGKALLR